jgi:hypothetical protein
VLVADPARGIGWLGQCGTDSYAGGQALVYDVLNLPAWRTISAWALLADSSDCILDYAFGTYVSPALTSPTPSPTLPPTATSGDSPTDPTDPTDPTVLLLVAGLAAAAVLVSLRRSGFVRR